VGTNVGSFFGREVTITKHTNVSSLKIDAAPGHHHQKFFQTPTMRPDILFRKKWDILVERDQTLFRVSTKHFGGTQAPGCASLIGIADARLCCPVALQRIYFDKAQHNSTIYIAITRIIFGPSCFILA